MTVGRRKMIQELRRIARTPKGNAILAALFARLDTERIDSYASTGNGSARLVAFHDAVSDAHDTMHAADRALQDGDVDEARALLALGQASLEEHITELKGLL